MQNMAIYLFTCLLRRHQRQLDQGKNLPSSSTVAGLDFHTRDWKGVYGGLCKVGALFS